MAIACPHIRLTIVLLEVYDLADIACYGRSPTTYTVPTSWV